MLNLKLTNSGKAALSITTISVGGTNSADFQQTNDCGASVAAGVFCFIGVTFKHTATGSRSATLSIGDNANGSPQTVTLVGTGAPPVTAKGTYTIAVTAKSGAIAHHASGAVGITKTSRNPGLSSFAKT